MKGAGLNYQLLLSKINTLKNDKIDNEINDVSLIEDNEVKIEPDLNVNNKKKKNGKYAFQNYEYELQGFQTKPVTG